MSGGRVAPPEPPGARGTGSNPVVAAKWDSTVRLCRNILSTRSKIKIEETQTIYSLWRSDSWCPTPIFGNQHARRQSRIQSPATSRNCSDDFSPRRGLASGRKIVGSVDPSALAKVQPLNLPRIPIRSDQVGNARGRSMHRVVVVGV